MSSPLHTDADVLAFVSRKAKERDAAELREEHERGCCADGCYFCEEAMLIGAVEREADLI